MFTCSESHPRSAGPCANQPKVISRVEPIYTEEARAAKLEGTIRMQMVIGTDGLASDIHIVKGLGMGLDEAAVSAVKQWKFEPGTLEDKPVAVYATMEVNFGLSDKKQPVKESVEPKPPTDGGAKPAAGPESTTEVSSAPLVPPSDAAPKPVHISTAVAEGLIIKKVEPGYPPIAKDARLQGLVVLQAVIDKSGEIKSVKAVSGHPMLLPAAFDAFKQWKFRPYYLNGEPVEVETIFRFYFLLQKK